MPFLKSLRLDGLLSFPPGSEAIPLTPLNVLIGPNGSGKSNLIEGIELLHALPTGFASAIREGGGVREWLWKGDGTLSSVIEAHIDVDHQLRDGVSPSLIEATDYEVPDLRYALSFSDVGQRVEITGEFIEDVGYTTVPPTDEQMYLRPAGEGSPLSYYRFQDGDLVVNLKSEWPASKNIRRETRSLDRRNIKPDESILAQLKDPFVYPELFEVGRKFEAIQSFREWTFGRGSEVRRPQRPDWPSDSLLPGAQNLGAVLDQLQLTERWPEFNGYLNRFLPRFQRCTVSSAGGRVQIFLHENGLRLPIPATRLSDGTIRFMAILAQLLSPTPPPLICMEEPELGLHPDAIALLAGLLQEASARTQLIVTTHSDALVSALTEVADSVLVCEYRGGTVFKRIESEKLRFWLEKYRLGEIWRIGEIGGNL
ncbi:MAG: AAA family ATPase [Terracidiphilus sp.]